MDARETQLDHVLIAVSELDEAARELSSRYGLASIEGGRHTGWGTANRIVPLGDSYLELVAVVDPREAAGSAFGRWVGEADPLPRPLGWAVRCGDLDAITARLGIPVSSNSRPTASGEVLRWRVAGIERAAAEPSLPILLEWGGGAPFPGSPPVRHPAGPVEISKLRLNGAAEALDAWLGPHELPVDFGPGPAELAAVVLRTSAGEIVLEAEQRD